MPPPIAPRDFEFISDLVERRAAIVLAPEKKYLVENRLNPLLEREGLKTFSALVEELRRRPTGPLATAVVEAMTTGETFFFRDNYPFAALREEVLPKLTAVNAPQRQLAVWSCACASGQEPYSIAMLIRDHFSFLTAWELRLVATDISGEMLQRAREGVYNSLEVARGLSREQLSRHFSAEGDRWRINENLRAMIEFRQLNLIDRWPELPPLDVVFLRNVLIYFAVETKRDILRRVAKLLKPGGYLFLGNAETTLSLESCFQRVPYNLAGCYRKIEPGT